MAAMDEFDQFLALSTVRLNTNDLPNGLALLSCVTHQGYVSPLSSPRYPDSEMFMCTELS